MPIGGLDFSFDQSGLCLPCSADKLMRYIIDDIGPYTIPVHLPTLPAWPPGLDPTRPFVLSTGTRQQVVVPRAVRRDRLRPPGWTIRR